MSGPSGIVQPTGKITSFLKFIWDNYGKIAWALVVEFLESIANFIGNSIGAAVDFIKGLFAEQEIEHICDYYEDYYEDYYGSSGTAGNGTMHGMASHDDDDDDDDDFYDFELTDKQHQVLEGLCYGNIP